MQKRFLKNQYVFTTVNVILISCCLLLYGSCINKNVNKKKNPPESGLQNTSEPDGSNSYVKYSSLQNIDSTWGFTVFVNSKPYLVYKKVPVPKAETGFLYKADAEKIANLFVKMIRNGDPNPVLSKELIDSLEVLIKKD